MGFSSYGAMGAVCAARGVADRMTDAIGALRRRDGCIRYEALAAQFDEADIVEHLREALFRAHKRMRAPWPGWPPQIAVDGKVTRILCMDGKRRTEASGWAGPERASLPAPAGRTEREASGWAGPERASLPAPAGRTQR